MALCSVWVSYADAIKSQSAFGVFLTSKNLSQWNFGTWHQRVSAKFWRDVMLLRVLPDTFGYAFPFAMRFGTLASRRLAAPMVAAVAAFGVPLAIFTNLHFIHSYYQYANAIFALAAVGIGITSILEAGYRRTAALCLTIIVAMQIQFFWQTYASYLTVDYSKRPLLQIALIAKDKTPADGSLIVLGDEWASAVPYYSERKAFALSWRPSVPFLTRLFANLKPILGTVPLPVSFTVATKLPTLAASCRWCRSLSPIARRWRSWQLPAPGAPALTRATARPISREGICRRSQGAFLEPGCFRLTASPVLFRRRMFFGRCPQARRDQANSNQHSDQTRDDEALGNDERCSNPDNDRIGSPNYRQRRSKFWPQRRHAASSGNQNKEKRSISQLMNDRIREGCEDH